MTSTTNDLEAKVEELTARLTQLESLLSSMQNAPAARHTTIPRTARQPAPPRVEIEPVTTEQSMISVIGRTLLAMGGAYFLRALTESNVLPQAAGVALGLAYVVFWMFMADRQAAQKRTAAATASCVLVALIAYPLTWEALARFHTFSVETASLILFGVTAALFVIAWHHGLSSAAWIGTLGATGCTLAVMGESGQVALPLVAYAIAAAVLWHIAGERGWVVVAWPAALGTLGMAVLLQLVVVARRGGDHSASAAVALLTVAIVYAAAVSAKTLLRRREMTLADAILTAAIIAVALTGAARISSTVKTLDYSVTIAVAALAAGSYMLSGMPQVSKTTHRYFAAIGVCCTLVATSILSTPTLAAVLWIVAAVISLAVSAVRSNSDFTIHAVVYTFAAAIAGGVLVSALSALSGVGTPAAITGARLAATAGIVVACAIGVVLRGADRTTRVASLIFLSLGVAVTLSVIVRALVSATSADAATAAAIRSGIIAIAAVALAFVGRTVRFSDASRLVYPVLGLGGAKFVVDDFIAGRAATLFVTLAMYGCALLVLARLRKATPVNATRQAAQASQAV